MADLRARQCLNEWLELWREIDTVYNRILKRWNLSLNALWAVEYLDAHPEGVEPAVLADATHMLRQTVTVVLNDLEERGYLYRDSHPTDRRRKLVKFTDNGKCFVREMLDNLQELEVRSISALDEEERRNLIDYSRRFCETLSRAGEDSNR